MAKRTKKRKPLTMRLSEENGETIEQLAIGTGRSENWVVNMLLDAARAYMKSGAPSAEQLKTFLRTAELAHTRAVEARAGERKAREALAKLAPPARIAKHLPRGAA